MADSPSTPLACGGERLCPKPFDTPRCFAYTSVMFVAVASEFAAEDHRRAAEELLVRYGFQRVLAGSWESAAVSEDALGRLKRDLDRVTDSDDSLRIYQYPVGGTLAITVLKEKRWRRLVVTR